MNICLISQEYPPDTNWGGIATYTQTLARQLVKIGQTVHVVTLAEKEECTVDDFGVTVHRVSRTPRTPYNPEELNGLSHSIINFSQRVYEKIRDIHETESIDVIEAPETCAQALLAFKRLKDIVKITRLHTPFFWVRHLNAMPEAPEHLVRDQLEKLQTELSTVVTSPTHAMAKVVKNQWGIENIVVIPNFFNLKTYTPDLSVYDQHLKGLDYILFFGRLEHRKGVHILAQALPEVLLEQRKIQAVFIGSDSTYNSMSMKSYVQQQLQDYKDRVIFIENIPHAALYPIIERAKLVALPSLWENFPYVCIETMSLGKAVVASNSGGFPEIIKPGSEGILFPPGNVDALKQAILSCLGNVDISALGENAKKKAQIFDTDKIVEEMLKFYQLIKEQRVAQQATREATTSYKIAYILRHIPVPSETFVINEIIALQSLGLSIYPVSLLPAQTCHESLMAKINHTVLDLSYLLSDAQAINSSYLSKASQLATEYKIAPVLASQAALAAEHILKNKIKHIHAHFATESAWVALIASKLTGIPFTFTAHAYDIFMRDKRIINEDCLEDRLKILVSNAARCFTISNFNKEYILSQTDQKHSNKIDIVRCGIDPGRFSPIDRPPKEFTTFLSVGRFVEKKGFEYTIRSFKKVADTLQNAQLRIVGEGNLMPAMEELCNELGIKDKVISLGAVSSEIVLQEMHNADVFVLHSITGANGDREGIPVSIMEASATGLPVIATKHSGISELVIEGVTGLLSPERDIESFANYMIALASSPLLRRKMGLAGRERVCSTFNQQIEAEKLKEDFIEIINSQTSTPSESNSLADSIDIIMPTYHPKLVLLRRAIQSILNQSFRNWQLYLVQDGNDSDIRSLLNEINDPRIHYTEMEHKGKPAALNVALSQGRSKHIAYLDDDDIWYPNHLSEAIAYMKKSGAQFIHTDSHEIFISIDGANYREISRRSLNKGVITDTTLWYISHINAVHERALVEKAGPYNDALPFFIDWDMFQRMAKYAKPHHLKVYTCEHYIYINRDNQESNTISSAHKRDPELSKKMHFEMFKRSFDLLTRDDFAEIIKDWQSKTSQLEEKSKHLTKAKNTFSQNLSDADFAQRLIETNAFIEKMDILLNNNISQIEEVIANHLKEKDARIEDIYNSLSWKITAPLRWGFEKVYLNLKNKI